MADSIEEKIDNRQPNIVSLQNKKDEYYRQIIINHIHFIGKQCEIVCSKINRYSFDSPTEDLPEDEQQLTNVDSLHEIDPETLVNNIIDRLKDNNYSVLRQFEKRAQLTTYIRTIISNTLIDLIRQIKGRSRAKDRAKKMGPLAEKIYHLVFEKGYPVDQAYDDLRTNEGITETLEEIRTIVEKIRGRQTSTPPPESITYGNPEKDLEEKQRQDLRKKILDRALSELNNEEGLVIRMRFPRTDDEEPKKPLEIARILGIPEKKVYSIISKALSKCKEMILAEGISVDDLINA